MRAASAQLIALLDTTGEQSFLMADLYTFTLVNGTVLRYTSADTDIVLSGDTYSSMGPRIASSPFKLTIGVEVDTMDLVIAPQSSDTINGLAFLYAMWQGAFDGAYVLRQRVFMPTWGDTSAGAIKLFYGKVADTGIDSGVARLRVNSLMELLNVMMPRHITQPACVHMLYDAGCTVNQADFIAYGVVQAGSTTTQIVHTFPHRNDFFTNGKLVFTSGANTGVVRGISRHVTGSLSMIIPLPAVPAVNDQYSLYPGCDKTPTTCSTKFNNLNNFKGFPYIPVPETSVGISSG